MNDQQNNDAEVQRGLTTDIAIAVGPTAAVVANHLLNKQSDEQAPKQEVELPPGVDKE